MKSTYLSSMKKQFAFYKILGERTFDQLTDPDLFWQYNPQSNSIAIIVHHLYGNMMSRFTDFLTSDGEKAWRQRDQEFESVIQTRTEMMEKWEAGWDCVYQALDSLTETDLETQIFIRNMGHTVTEALNRQLSHYASHIGQIVYIGRMRKGEEWQSLSIPKGASKTHNAEKFSQPKRRAHFTEGYLPQEEEN